MCLLIYGDVMIEYVLVAVLHLYGDKLGPEMVIDFYPTEQECIEQAANAQFIVDEIQNQWYGFIEEERRHGHYVPHIESIGMFCKPLDKIPGEEI
tara:strand:+ start:885 stop:1169 length:285 start_codon:yes stop_codon:yes gene_type:complete